MTQCINQTAWLALGLCMFGCAPGEQASVSSPAITTGSNAAPVTPPPSAAAQAGHSASPTSTQPAAASTLPPAAMSSSVPPAGMAQSAPPMAAAAATPAAPATPPVNHEAAHAAAGAPATPPAGAAPSFPGVGAAESADSFCAKYEMHCHYGQPMRHADKAACIADYNGNPAQQGCKSMHLDTAIAGTAAACNGMASDFCFSIHCLHAAGLPDPTGTTYCK